MEGIVKATLQINGRKGYIDIQGASGRTKRNISNYLLDSFAVDDSYLDNEHDLIAIQCWHTTIDTETVISALNDFAEENGCQIQIGSK